MRKDIIGRHQEQHVLEECVKTRKSELIAVYGRRRIGKTFLVRNFFDETFDFYMTGSPDRTKGELLLIFNEQLRYYSGFNYPIVKTWHDAFGQLREYLSKISKEKVIVFIDEMPWFDTPNSGFIKSFELFWNGWASAQSNIKFVVCGSATTWMLNKFIGDKGGLHNRVTRSICLAPFSLGETEEYLKSQNIVWSRYDITECYMIMGGTPYYLSKLERGKSLVQNIDYLFFSRTGELRREFDFLYRSLFSNSKNHMKVVELLSKKTKGMTRNEIMKALDMPKGGNITEILSNLIACDFVRCYHAFGKKERDMLYQLTDLYTLYYLRFCRNIEGKDEHTWSLMINTPAHSAWAGYSFEMVCLHHIPQIKAALGISGILSNVCSWQNKQTTNGESGFQIDLIIDRQDNVINLCEIKYSRAPFAIDKKYSLRLLERAEAFRISTKTNKAIHLTFISTYGLKQNMYSSTAQNELTMNALFGL